MAHAGEAESGLQRMRSGLDAFQRAGVGLGRPFLLYLLADVCRLAGKIDDGLATLTEAHQIAKSTQTMFEPELHRLEGALLLVQSDGGQKDSEVCFERAIECARSQNSRMLELRATVALGRLWRQLGRGAAAERMLRPLYESFDEGGDTADLHEARELLNEK